MAAPQMRLYFATIKPTINSKGSIEVEVAALLARRTKKFVRDYKKVSGKFKNEKVNYKTVVTRGRPPTGGSARMYGVAWTSSDVMYWLDLGTTVRYATMSSDFRSKTFPRGGIKTRSGRGRLAYVDRSQPRDGIEAREFTQDIVDRQAEEFFLEMEALFAKARAQFFGQSKIVY